MEGRMINLKEKFNIEGVGTLEVFKNNEANPMIIIVPGGAYDHISTREGMPVVNKFLSFGYNCALLKYSVAPSYHYPTPLNELNACIQYLNKEYKHIFLMGFSAGGHLIGLGGTDTYSSLLSGLIFCYPVISLGEYTHIGSQRNLLAEINTKENQEKYSIQNRVNKLTPPAFIWCSKTDEAVPYNNSVLLDEAYNKNNIYHEFKIYPNGPHGMALADETATAGGHEKCFNKEVQGWVKLADSFIKKVIANEK